MGKPVLRSTKADRQLVPALLRALHRHLKVLPLDRVPAVGQHAMAREEDLTVGALAEHGAELKVDHLHAVVQMGSANAPSQAQQHEAADFS